jgi:hypothetical protein
MATNAPCSFQHGHIGTAKLNGLDPDTYLREVFARSSGIHESSLDENRWMRVKAASVLGYLRRREHQLQEMLYLTLLLAVRPCDLEIRNRWIIFYLNEGRS